MTEATAPEQSQARKPMMSVQIMRGVAALAVVFYHTYLILAQPNYGAREILGDWASKGWVGVNFFFVLSGFIIFYAHRSDLGKPAALPRYFWRRFVRLYPIYWLCLAAYILAASAGLGAPDFSYDWWNLAASFLLIDIGAEQTLPLKVAWTLLYEIRFYIIFALMLVSVRIGLAVMAVWLAGIAAANLVWPGFGGTFFSLWNIYFLFGIAAAWLLPRLPRAVMPVLLVGAIAALGWTIAGIDYRISEGERSGSLLMALAFGFTALLLGGVMAERHFRLEFPRWLLLLGDASYSIYLVHSAVISIIAALVFRLLPPEFPDLPIFLFTFAAASLFGVLVHLVIERPTLDLLRRFSPSSTSWQPRAAGLAEK